MNLQTRKILGVDVTVSSEQESLEEIRKYLTKSPNPKSEIRKNDVKPFVIFTPNPEIISYAQKDDNFIRTVNTAQINLPDGTGLVWAIKKLHGEVVERIPGIDFMGKLVNLAARESLTIGLIGGKAGLADATAECLRKNHPKLTGWAMDGPDLQITNHNLQISDQEIKRITKKIISEKTSILFVGFGFPKQEYFIDLIRRQLTIFNYQLPILLMAVGGSFDYISGRIPRAPKFIRNLGFEWLFRLIREPWRLSRQLNGAEFFWKILTSGK